MKTEQLVRNIRMLMEQDIDLLARKNHDYSAEDDALSNFRDFGWQGIVVRIGDKYNRLKEMAKGKSPKNESIIDSLIDLAVYSYLARVVLCEGGGVDPYEDFLKKSEKYAEMKIDKEISRN